MSSSNTITDNTTDTIVRFDLHKKCTHCMRPGYLIENCAYKKAEDDEEKKLLLNSCQLCLTRDHDKKKCPLLPDSPCTKSRKYNLYIKGGDYQGKHYYGGDHQGGSEYLQEQLNKKYALMTPEEYKEHMENVEYLDDDYMWACFD